MHLIDWLILGAFLVVLAGLTLSTRSRMKSVADFLAANRLAGRYLLTVSYGWGGAITIIAAWEMLYAAGLPTQWWSMMSAPVGLMLALTGFIIYRFRQTRALTLAQFFEIRYSRRFRLFAGLLSWLSGMFNYGIFPAISTRFMMLVFGFPEVVHLLGFDILTFPLLMACYLSIAMIPPLVGGQIALIVTDFLQGALALLIFVVLMLYILHRFEWQDIVIGLQVAPPGQSMIDPFDSGKTQDFNIWFFLILVFGKIYNARSWQGHSGFNASARTPHEAKMAAVLGSWRLFIGELSVLLFPLIAYAILRNPTFAGIAAPIAAEIDVIADPTIRQQMTVPMVLTHLLPVGLMGLFATWIVAAAISTDNTYMHSWGSIFVQDVVLPLRRKPLSPEAHLRLLRLAIVGVAVFGFTFSLFFPLRQYVLMYFALTAAIYLGGAGAVIIGGLYWSRGTTRAAWVAMISGSTLAFGGLLAQYIWAPYVVPALQGWFPESTWLEANAAKFPINGQVMYFIAMMTASLVYIVVSLLGPKQRHNMDKLLHRGAYAVAGDKPNAAGPVDRSWKQLMGLAPEFTMRERMLFWGTFWWSIGWWGIFVVGNIARGFFHFTDDHWAAFWWFKIWISIVLAIGLAGWFIYGGVRDLRRLYADLRHRVVDVTDDGTITVPKKSDSATGGPNLSINAVDAGKPILKIQNR